ENIEPEPIETALSLSPFISQVIIVGQDRKHLGALIVPYRQAIEDYCHAHNIRCSDKEELIEYPEIVQLIKNEIDRLHNKKESTGPWAKIIRFKLIPEEWTTQGGLLTFTLKKKRTAIAAIFQEEIENLYR
ncbi:MAG: long-chain fatty acid--CoA ligase, partial [Deltaproteobacteria bacterium]|nr:long-chain fatty acid--CoA ligase [Deltaproteobacteria bacterium]